jgi:uncharacterized membrane protein
MWHCRQRIRNSTMIMTQPHDSTASSAPPGWDYNPSSGSQRAPIIILALVGTAIAGYLTLYQVGLIATVWEPYFGAGSERILTSWVSQLLHPIPDAGLGALSYFVDAIAGAIGGQRRWKSMPWMVILFGLAVGPLGVVSVVLVILQPVLFDSWCTLCLVSGAISVLMIGPAMDEVLASLQHLKHEARQGRSVWRAFWGLPPRRISVAHKSAVA